jgi:TonB family protein
MSALVDVVIRSSAIVVVGLVLMPILRRHSAAFRHWVLFTTLLCAVAGPAVAPYLPSWEPPLPVTAGITSQITERVQVLVATTAGRATRVTSVPLAPSPAFSATQPESGLLGAVWVAGVLLSLATLAIGLVRLRHLHNTAAAVCDGVWVEALGRFPLSNRRRIPAQVRATERPGLLIVWGWQQPTIIVSTQALSWSRERVDAALQHELAHVARHDWMFQIVAEIVRAVYWFNPMVWMACARLRTESEIACDDAVITGGMPGSMYAAHVVAVARALTARHWLPAPAIGRASSLERRVRAMLDKTRNRRPLTGRSKAAALSLLVAVTIAVAALAAQSFVSLHGTIVDPTDAVLPGVKLMLVNEQTQAKYEIQTDRNGRYEFVGLPPGHYNMEAALPGFSRFSGRVAVGGQNLQQDLTMEVGRVEETITIRQDEVAPSPDPERERKLEEFKQRRAEALVGMKARCAGQGAAETRMGGNLRVPVKLRDFRPTYPASQRGIEGTVVLTATITTSGSTEVVDIVSSAHPDFTQSAIDAVKQWEFDATLLNCDRIATPMRVTVNYRLR